MKYGYIRPIELKDTIIEQETQLSKLADEILIENHPKNKNRVILERLINEMVNDGDTLIATDWFILADSTKHLDDILKLLKEKQFKIQILNENIIVDSQTEMNFVKMFDMISQFQSDVVRFRTKIGIEKRRSEGKQMGRPKRSDENLHNAIEMYLSKQYTLDEIKEATNISRATLYRHLDK